MLFVFDINDKTSKRTLKHLFFYLVVLFFPSFPPFPIYTNREGNRLPERKFMVWMQTKNVLISKPKLL